MDGSRSRFWSPRLAMTKNRALWIAFCCVMFCVALLLLDLARPLFVPLPTKLGPSVDLTNSTQETPVVIQTTSLEQVIHRATEAGHRFRRDVKDYRARLVKRERVGSTLMDPQEMSIKILNRQYDSQYESSLPEQTKFTSGLHAYLRFTSPASVAGREVIWVEGKNDDKLTAHEAGILNLMSLDLEPNGTIAMMGSKYPITEIGIEKLLDKLIERGRKDSVLEQPEVTVTSGSLFGTVSCDRIRIIHPKKQDGFDFHIAEVWIDPKKEIPIYYASYDWPAKEGDSPPLLEEYGYHDLEINVGLGEADFDKDNSEYHFP